MTVISEKMSDSETDEEIYAPNPGDFEEVQQQQQVPQNLQVANQTLISKRDNAKYVHEFHEFWHQKGSKDGTKSFWHCAYYRKSGCRCRLHVDILSNQVIKKLGSHQGHGINPTSIPVQQFKNTVKIRGTLTVEAPADIYNLALEGIPESVQAKCDKSAARKIITRKRIEQGQTQIGGDSSQWPEVYRYYQFAGNQPELFLLADFAYGPPNEINNKILIFGRESHRTWADRMQVVYMDGTFKITPPPFYQVYIISAERGNYVFPILYVLTTGKTKECYIAMLRKIKDIYPNFYPAAFSIDFEEGVLGAVREVFPNSAVWGCFFHLYQNFKKKLNKTNMLNRYNADPDFASKCKMIVGLAFLDPAEIKDNFASLSEYLGDEFEPILDWMEKYYIGYEVRRGNRTVAVNARFPPEMWSVYQRTLNGESRTNNYAEAANRRIQAELGTCHPTLGRFVLCLKKVQHGRDQLYTQWISGKPPKDKRTKYREADQRILKILGEYVRNERTLYELLRGVANNVVIDDDVDNNAGNSDTDL